MPDATERFAELVAPARRRDRARRSRVARSPLHAHPDLDVEARLAQLDELARATAGDDRRRKLAGSLFADRGFAGNTIDYGDPAQLVPRRRARPAARHPDHAERADDRGGAPAAASPLHGVGMPGHFLVGGGAASGTTRSTAAPASTRRLRGAVRAAPTTRRVVPTSRSWIRSGPLGDPRSDARQPAALVARSAIRPSAAWPTRLRLRFPGSRWRSAASSPGCSGSLGQFAEAARELRRARARAPGRGRRAGRSCGRPRAFRAPRPN